MKRKMLFIQKPMPGGTMVRSCLALLLATVMILPALAQVNSYERYIYLSGQLTNTLTGAPIPDHEIYITADSTANNGFSYYAVAKTDVNGFYMDTITTTAADGLLTIHLFDLSNNILEIDRYYRFIWQNTYLMFANFSILDPNTTFEFQANFKTSGAHTQDDPLKVLFRDLSIGNSIKAWEWDFGDGHSSEMQDPEHTYAKPGVYLVTLTVSSLPPEFEVYMKSSITKQVQVGLTEFAHLGGHVFAEYFPIDFGLAYLYAYDEEENLIPVDTTPIDTLGYYYFYQLPAGRYLTKARLAAHSALYGKFMPTYYGNVYNWYEAQPIILEENNFECDIALLPSTGSYNGFGQIVGQISYDTTHSSGELWPAGDIEILLLSQDGSSLTCNLSDMEGYFFFQDIAFGTYQLFPDVAGTPTTPMYVTISEDKPNASDLTLVILPEQITFSINEPQSEFIGEVFLLYPNPVRDEARLALSMKKSSTVSLMITDLAGRTISRKEYIFHAGENDAVFDVRHLPAGCYQVTLIPEDRRPVSGKFLKYN